MAKTELVPTRKPSSSENGNHHKLLAHLPPMERAVVYAYLSDPKRNRLRAYKHYYPEAEDAYAKKRMGTILRDGRVDKFIRIEEDRISRLAIDQYQMSAETILQELAAMIFFDPRKMFDENGHMIPIHKVDDATAKAIQSIDFEEVRYLGDGDSLRSTQTKRIRFTPKTAAVDMAMKHFGQFNRHGANGKGPASSNDAPVQNIMINLSDEKLARRFLNVIDGDFKGLMKVALGIDNVDQQ
jgi:phage terminase small subunit